MNPASGDPTAAELLKSLSETEIADLIYKYGEERFSRRIAWRIVEKRKAGSPVETTRELAALVERSVKRSPKEKTHPATRTFQALRIAVNHEIEVLEDFIASAADSLKTDGKLAVISFHSLEDPGRETGLPKALRQMHLPAANSAVHLRCRKKGRDFNKEADRSGPEELERNLRVQECQAPGREKTLGENPKILPKYMHTRNLSRTRTRSASSAQAIQLNWQYVLLVLVCGAVVAAGFFFAARQHFMSMDYGLRTRS